MANLLMVVKNSSFLVIQTKQKLEELKYKVITVEPDTDEIHGVQDELSAILIFGDPKMDEEASALTYLKDRALEENLPIFIFGYADEIKLVKEYVSDKQIKDEFVRPINVREAVDTIENYIKKYGNQNKSKILVVDDSGAMLRNVKGWLENKYNVILANSGAMAIKALSINKPDLVLLDYEMPIVDGKQVLQMIRSEMDFATIPVIFLTSRDDEESVKAVMELRVQGYLLKTQSPSAIIKYIDDFFENLKAAKM